MPTCFRWLQKGKSPPSASPTPLFSRHPITTPSFVTSTDKLFQIIKQFFSNVKHWIASIKLSTLFSIPKLHSTSTSHSKTSRYLTTSVKPLATSVIRTPALATTSTPSRHQYNIVFSFLNYSKMFLLKLLALLAAVVMIIMAIKTLQNISTGILHCRSNLEKKVSKMQRLDHLQNVESFDSHINGLMGQRNESDEDQNQKTRFKIPLESLWHVGPKDDVQSQYKDHIKDLKIELMQNERKCRHIQQQLEWMSNKTTELEDEVLEGQRIYTAAVGDLATNIKHVQQCSKRRNVEPPYVKAGLVSKNCPLLSRLKSA